jgi:NADH-quinone oxidoreductase subunit B
VGLIEGRFDKNLATDAVDTVLNLGRAYSLWPLGYGLACCAIEMIHATTARWDIARFGAEVFRPSPRQADVMIVAGTVTRGAHPPPALRPDARPEVRHRHGRLRDRRRPFRTYSVGRGGHDRPRGRLRRGRSPRPENLLRAFVLLRSA